MVEKRKIKCDEYGLIEVNGKYFREKYYNSEKLELVFEQVEDASEFKEMFDKIIDELEKHIDKRKLLADVLRHYPKHEIMNIHERIYEKQQSVRPRRGCYSIMVGRKEVVIRD